MNDTDHSRRHFLTAGSAGLSSLAFSYLLQQDEARANPAKPIAEKKSFDLTPQEPPLEPRAKAMISLWMQGGPSHHDLTDPKPLMKEYDGKTFPGEIKYDNAAQASSKVFATPWKFAPRGECGMELSELIPEIAGVADDICLIRSMKTGVNNHGQSIRALINGRILGGRPTIGSWLTYALGSETQNLPAYMALIDPGQLPVMGVENWSNGFLPAIYQGTVIRAQEPRILNLQPPQHLRGKVQDRSLAFLKQLNDRHYGSRCLIARRLVERGVRFVQVFTQNQLWDSHGSIISRLPAACRKVDKGSAALVADLKRLGLLDTTVVQWGGEMGRLPVIQNDAGRDKLGRDHNTYGFSHWYAGGGFKAGHVHGATDEWGHYAVEGTVNHFDIHATLLRLFGLDHSELTYRWAGRLQSLTDGQEGQVVKELLS
jgi:hypothetical protein